MLKKAISFVMALSLCTAMLSVPAFAENSELELPADTMLLSDSEAGSISIMSFNSASASLSISGTTATCTTVVKGTSSTTSISIYMYLQRYINGSWTTYSSWSSSYSAKSATLKKTASITKGYKYRVKASVYGYGSSPKNGTYYSSQISV